MLTVNPTLPAQTVNDLVALIKANPGKYSYASGGGIGSPGHLVGEQFRLSLGLDLVHVPFNGANLAIGSVVAGPKKRGARKKSRAAVSRTPPYKCVHTPYDHTRCLKFLYNPATGRWDVPAGEIDCRQCQYFGVVAHVLG
jgi:Tripartite tricarboxylate transporter family receptor